MGDILGVGCTHRPVMLRRNEDWTYKPLHNPMGHAFEDTLLLLDDKRVGFDYPLVSFSVNQPASLHGGRRRHGADHGRQPVAGGADGVVELVAFVPDREESRAKARAAF